MITGLVRGKIGPFGKSELAQHAGNRGQAMPRCAGIIFAGRTGCF